MDQAGNNKPNKRASVGWNRAFWRRLIYRSEGPGRKNKENGRERAWLEAERFELSVSYMTSLLRQAQKL